jgi:hypothetical protein
VNEPAPANRPQTEFLHDAAEPFGVDRNSATLQLALDTAIPIAGKLGMDIVNPAAKLVILGDTLLGALAIGLVVIGAG